MRTWFKTQRWRHRGHWTPGRVLWCVWLVIGVPVGCCFNGSAALTREPRSFLIPWILYGLIAAGGLVVTRFLRHVPDLMWALSLVALLLAIAAGVLVAMR